MNFGFFNLELFIIGFVAALTPGPDILLVIQTTLNNSVKEGLKTLSGILTGNIIMISVLVAGFASIGKSILFQMIVSLFGGLYLLYVSFNIFRHRFDEIKSSQIKAKTFYLKGLYVNLSNPKAIIFFSAILAPFLGNRLLVVNVLSLFFGILLAFLSVVFLTDIFRKNLLNPNVFSIINTISSLIFFFFSFELFFHFYKLAVGIVKILRV